MKLCPAIFALAAGLLAASAAAQPAPASDALEFQIRAPKKTDSLTHEFPGGLALMPACTGQVRGRPAAAVEVRDLSRSKAHLRGNFEQGDIVLLSCKLILRRH